MNLNNGELKQTSKYKISKYGYFQQDRARAHTAAAALETIRKFFGNHVISLNTEQEFTSGSCDITPCDFFL